MKKEYSISHSIFISLLLTLLFGSVTFLVLNLPFSQGDDHRILAMNHPEKMDSAYTKALFEKSPGLGGSIAIDAKIGRFRPAGWAWTKLQSVIFSDNQFSWRLMNLAVLFFSVLFLSLICRRLGANGISAGVILLVYVFGRNNETWWTLIPPAQNIGELLLLAGFFSWLRYRDPDATGKHKTKNKIIALSCFLLSALTKESFLFCIPFIGLADLLFFNSKRKLLLPEYYQLLGVFVFPFGGLLSVILFSRQVYGYPYPYSTLSIVTYNSWQFFHASVFLVAPLLMFFFRDHIITRRNLVKLLFLTLSWFIVQAILLKSIRMDDQHHYLVPGILPVLALSAMAIHYLEQRSKAVSRIVAGFYFLFALWQGKNTFVNAGYYSARVKSFYAMTNEIKRSAPRKIIYMTDQPAAGDWLMGTSGIFRAQGIAAPLYFCSVADSVPTWQKDFLNSRPRLTFPKIEFKKLELEAGDWVIFPDHFSRKNVPPPLIDFSGFGPRIGNESSGYIPVKEAKQFSESYYDLRASMLLEKESALSGAGFWAVQIN